MKVYECLDVRNIEGIHFGVECEVEGRKLPAVVSDEWRVEQDGSLRDGLEYVFDGPLKPAAAKKALKTLFKKFEEHKTMLDYSFRTSTHVHANVRDMEIKHVLNAVFLYILVEDLFTNFCAENRRGNRFCLRFKDAQWLYTVVSQMAQNIHAGNEPRAIVGVDQNTVKYSALNLYTLQKYGTLEFRTLEGTNDYNKIVMWMDTIQRLLEVSKEFDSLTELHATFFADPEAIVDRIFTDPVFKFDGWKQSVEESYSQAYHIVLSSKGVI